MAWANIIACLGALALYEFYIRRRTLKAPTKTGRSAHAAIRSDWVKSVMSRPGTEILVIQTLRNSVMAASFMATTAILALSGTVTLSGVGNSASGFWLSAHDSDDEFIIFAVKLVLLEGAFFVSFLFMAMAVRFFNHVGYIITGEIGSDESTRKQALAIAYLNRAGLYYSLGLRAFFLSIPFLVGLFNTYLMLPATLLLIFMLYWFDDVPAI
ncbi:MAG: DUF599 domain-containing protein [Pseudomonadota bacterium]